MCFACLLLLLLLLLQFAPLSGEMRHLRLLSVLPAHQVWHAAFLERGEGEGEKGGGAEVELNFSYEFDN